VKTLITILVALAIATLAFLVRFNALGGALGGFDNDEFFILTRADAILDGEQPLRDFSDAELRAVWPSLSYQIPAWAEQVWGRTLLVYARLVCGALALCAVIVFLAARAIAGGWMVPVLAALTVIASYAKPYNYPKPLTLGVAILLLSWTIARPTKIRIALLAGWTVVAALFRHDYAVYVGVAAVVGLVLAPGRLRATTRVAWYVALSVVFALPSLIWLQYYKGIPQYLGDVLASIKGEGRRLVSWPAIDVAHPFSADSLTAFVYYLFWIVPLIATAVLIASWWRRGWNARHPLGLALLLMTLVVDYFFLRGNLPARFGDAVVAVVLLIAWMAAPGSNARERTGSVIPGALASALLVTTIAAFFPINSIASELSTGGFAEGSVAARFLQVSDLLRNQPPRIWTFKPRDGSLAIARYIAECTVPEDRVLVATAADEIPYFSRRHFAGGQAAFYSNLLKSEDNQRLVLARLARQSVPIMVTHPDYHEEFEVNYPLVAQYVATRYREVGVVGYEGHPILRVLVETARQPVRVDPVLGYPCFR